jgi:hypothetical protein
MDVMVAKEVLANLIEAGQELGIEAQNVPKWKSMLDLLPAMPDEEMLKGSISGTLARKQIRIDRMDWDRQAGTLRLELTSAISQTVIFRLPKAAAITSFKVSGATAKGAPAPNAREVTLPGGKRIAADITYK